MTRTELEHIIRAVAAITNENELISDRKPGDPGAVSGRARQVAGVEGSRRLCPGTARSLRPDRRRTGRVESVRGDVRIPGRRGRPRNRHPSRWLEGSADSDREREPGLVADTARKLPEAVDRAIGEARNQDHRKFPQSPDDLNSLLRGIRLVEHRPALRYPATLPEKDRPILQAAVAWGATHLLTGDLKDFGPFMNQPGETFGILVQTVAEFLRARNDA